MRQDEPTVNRSPEDHETLVATAQWRARLSSDWLDHADRLEAMLEPVDGPLLEAAGLRPGESVVDVGCGRGATARKAAVQVGAHGSMTGIDVGEPVIVAARTVPALPDAAPMSFIVADAGTHRLGKVADVVISRFGVMFFPEPDAAFRNLRSMVDAGGRLAVAVWGPRSTSEFQARSLAVAVSAARERGVTLVLPGELAGPFRYGDPQWFQGLLHAAGWTDIVIATVHLGLYVGGPGCSPQEAAALGMANGPLAVLTAPLDADTRAHITGRVAKDLAAAWDGTGVRLDAAVSIVTAQGG